MYQLTAVYAHPGDPEAFVAHYRDKHAKIAAQLPDVRFYDWHVCESLDGSTPAYFLAAIVQWDSKEAAVASLGSGVGQQAVADMANFAEAGCEMHFGEVTVVVPATNA
ncbi:EthD family reductase [Pseudonocardia kujensis]|uniref:EthD family reductase n=1 Tax=Pseudonocardia kujensis TaxID=1128675 RepID=UPI001E521CBE|nr:EthD family reductase [Pseudonocardia kujensis]MCE0762071.1 EthD family reductase [Pseudonocardia kujensis]